MKTKINDIQIAYGRQAGSGVPLVLLHGFGLNRSIWDDLSVNYLKGINLVVPDVRGHGETDANEGFYSMDLLAADLAGLLRYLDIEKAIVCGHSMGGYIALAFAERYPELLAGLGLITTNASSDDSQKRAGRYAQIEEIKIRGSAAVADSLAPRLSHNSVIVERAHRMISKTSPIGLMGALGGMAERPDRSTVLERITQPAIVVAGVLDQITDYETSKEMATALTNGTLFSLKNAGHMPMADAPAELAGALLALKTQCDEGKAHRESYQSNDQ